MTNANPSNTDIAQQWADRYVEQVDYLTRVFAALTTEGGHPLKTTDQCTECDTSLLDDDFELSAHWIMWDPQSQRHVVVIACEGYWLIEPASVGLDNEMWSGIEGINV
jgi:hypothetical protein